MSKTILTEDMKKLLKDMIGKRFLSYECVWEEKYKRTYGNVRLYLEGYTLEVTNEEHPATFFGTTEDISYFECLIDDPNQAFKPYAIEETGKYPVNKLVTGVEIINDQIDVGNGKYLFSFDQAIIIHLGNEILMLARDIWFSEIIGIRDNDDYESYCPIAKIVDTMNCYGKYSVTVNRSRTAL